MTAGRTVNSQSHHWCTPKKYVDAIYQFFDGEVELDPCSNEYSIVNAKVEYKLPYDDGLNKDWNFNKIYINPPYGRDKERKTSIKDWLIKCEETHLKYQSEILSLIPVATNTSHWKECIFGKAKSVCFLYDTRLKFRINGNEENKGSPMACCMVYWGNDYVKFKEMFSTYGYVVEL